MAAGCPQDPPFLETDKFRECIRATARLTDFFGATYGTLGTGWEPWEDSLLPLLISAWRWPS
eukprot:14588172-Ditylum_brightwellii.AAC.1